MTFSKQLHTLAAVVVLGALVWASDACAESADEHLEQLEKQVRLLSQAVYNAPNGAPLGVPTSGPVKTPDGAVAREMRMSGLETQIRDLTGQVEDVHHKVTVVQTDAKTQASDLDVRLGEITEAVEAIKAELEGLKAGGASGKKQILKKDAGDKSLPTQNLADKSHADKVAAPPSPKAKSASQDAVAGSQSKAAQGQADQATAPSEKQQAAGTEGGQPKSVIKEVASTLDLVEGLEHAKVLIKAGELDQARILLQKLIAQRPPHKRVGKAYYWLGEIYARTGDWVEAMSVFAEGYEKMPKGPDAPDLLFKLAQGFEKQGRRDDACITVQALLIRPGLSESLKQASAKQVKRLACGHR